MARPGCRTARCQILAIAILSVTGMLVADAAAGHGPTRAPEQQTVEQLEAAVIMTFARFVEWSPKEFSSPTAPIVVGIIGDEAVAAALETIARGKNVAGRTMTVKRLQWDSEIAGVHMVFIGEPERRRLRVVLDRIRSRQIVSVSGLPDFGRTGGMITLTFTDGRIGFAVNSAATALSGVRLSSFLLSHATKVSDESGGAGR